MISKSLISLITIVTLSACSHTEPLEAALAQPVASRATPALTDQAVIAEAVGPSDVGGTALAWALQLPAVRGLSSR